MNECTAIVVEAPGRMVQRHFPVPEPGTGEFLLKIERVAICGSDPKLFKGYHKRSSFPKILGHELVGFVHRLGPGAYKKYGVKEGERVVVEPYILCGSCRYCLTGNYQSCERGRNYGVSFTCDKPPYLLGGYAQYMLVIEGSKVHHIHRDVPANAAVLTSVIGNGIRWVRTKGNVTIGDSVLIIGPGSQGLASTIAASLCGADPIVVIGLPRDKARIELALEFGAHHGVIIGDGIDPFPQALAPNGGALYDVVIECAGAATAISLGLQCVRPQGRYVLAGLTGGKKVELITDRIVNDEIQIHGGHGQAWDVEAAVKIVNSHRFAIEKIITHEFPLAEADKGMRFFIDNPHQCNRVALVP